LGLQRKIVEQMSNALATKQTSAEIGTFLHLANIFDSRQIKSSSVGTRQRAALMGQLKQKLLFQ